MLTREDLKKEAADFINEEEYLGNTLLLKHEMYTGGITYLSLLFDLKNILQEDVPYLGILKAVLGYVDTKHYSYGDLANEINLNTGGISSNISVYQSLKTYGEFTAKFEVRGKFLPEKTKEAFSLIEDILTGSSLSDEKRLYEIIAQVKSRLQIALSSAGHSVSALRAMSYFSKAAKYSDMTGGIALYRLVADIEEHFEEKKEGLRAKLKELFVKIFRSENLMVSVTAETKGIDSVREEMGHFMQCLYTQEKNV